MSEVATPIFNARPLIQETLALLTLFPQLLRLGEKIDLSVVQDAITTLLQRASMTRARKPMLRQMFLLPTSRM